MPFLDSLDIANRAIMHLGGNKILSVTEDSKNNNVMSDLYDTERRAELRRNSWRYATRRVTLRPLTPTTLKLKPDLWDITVNYLPGSIVSDSNGVLWASMTAENLGNPPGSSTAWETYFGPMTADLFTVTTPPTTYSAGELVYVPAGNPGGFVVFMSLAQANSSVPTTATAWSATTTYNLDDVVSYAGSQWRSLIVLNTNVTPVDAPAIWSSTITYSIGNQVVGSDGYVYTSSANGNIGNTPIIDGGAHWTNTGVPAAWSRTPTIYPSSPSWMPIYATLTNMRFMYPISNGTGDDYAVKNVFHLPAGHLRAAPQDPKAGSVSNIGGPSGARYNDWLLEGNFIITEQAAPFTYRFVADIQRVTEMDDLFCEGLAARMAMEGCEQITQSTSKQGLVAQKYTKFIEDARTVNSIEVGSEEPPEDDWITCRG